MPELSIRKIIEKTLSGEIRIPSFQRGFVWEPEKVAFFIDSLYKGYPIGSLLFWRTNIRLENERQLGNYSLPEPTKGYPLDYVFVALLASTSPKSFISGANVNLSEPMKLANSKEFHHIFPAKYLQRLGLARNRIFCLANFCFLNNADNQRIKDKAPAEYCKMMNSDKINDILQSALCPSQTFCLDYDTFLNERSKILVDQAKVLCGMAG